MNNEISDYWEKIKSCEGEEQIKFFVEFCGRLVEYKEAGLISEEVAAQHMLGSIVRFENLSESPLLTEIFDISTNTELERECFYAQKKEVWNKEDADRIKQDEWRRLVKAIETTKTKVC